MSSMLDNWLGKLAGGTRRKSAPGLLVLSLTAIGLVCSLLLVWSTISSERAAREQAILTSEMMSALRDIDRAAINAETGQRGYFITLDQRYLANYEFGRTLYPRAVARLRNKVRQGTDLPRQEQLLATIEQRGDAMFADLEGTVDLIRRGEIREAQQRMLSDEGRLAMERLRESLTEMEVLEQGVLAEAAANASASENRVLPLLALTLVLTLGSLGLGLWSAVRVNHAEAQAAQTQKLAAARDRADLLAHELNHRVKNLFAVILAIVRMSSRNAPEARDVTDGISARIHALLDAHEATQGRDADGTGQMRTLVDKVLAPYASDSNPVVVSGPDVTLTPREATPLGLVLHELATNAVKYGAWSQDSGEIRIHWEFRDHDAERMLVLVWREIAPASSSSPSDERTGFGTMLMQSSARQLGGTIDRRFGDDGLIVDIAFPHPA